jgi:superfamily II DNA or RNA helicase
MKNIANQPAVGLKVMSQYNAVFFDECHQAKATESTAILEKCRNASYRIGTTGTLDNQKIHQLQIEGYLGPVHKVITTKELMDSGQVSQLDIRCMSLVYPDDIKKSMKKTKYPDEIEFLLGLNKRNEFIAKMACATVGTTLVLTKLRDKHAKPLYELISSMTDKPVYFVAGTIKATEREAIRKVANIEDCVIVATTQTMSTGVNIPNLRNVLFALPSKDVITITQSIGRGLRLAEGKEKMTLIDIIDDIRYGKRENYAYEHALERIALYRKEKFNVTVTEIPFQP